ncbi:Ion transport peptide [Temnothorax longispinosus]|uniref:Ion transport peptide n=1 Tax=Temnothorax longispinosus TaxID=300112 RepID=A0A4S2KIK8_9HYME|nr:Ion transport peptide [Temnothorax longispinosus]
MQMLQKLIISDDLITGLIDLSVPDLCPRRRQDCFSTQYFTSCIQALLLEDEKERLQEMVEYLGRKK